MNIPRKLSQTIYSSLQHFPAVGIIGSRQVGKTTLAKQLNQKSVGKSIVYLDLELPSDLNKLREPELYLKQHQNELVVIDEIQRMPELFPLLRALIDKHRTNGRFLILGSAAPHMIKKASESLAGRIIYHELTPLTFTEIQPFTISTQRLWWRGGYPQSVTAKTDKLSFQWRHAFIQTHIERDLPQFGIHAQSIRLSRFVTMLAHWHGQLWNASQLAKSLGISAPTVKEYVDIFTNTFITRQLQPYYTNTKKRLVKSPKIYIRDSGILHALLGLHTFEQLQSHPIIGNSWEGFVIEQILSTFSYQHQPFFYCTGSGAELDLLLHDGSKPPIAIEVKYSLSPTVQKGFWQAYTDLHCKKGYIIYPGSEMYQLQKGVTVLPFTHLQHIFE